MSRSGCSDANESTTLQMRYDDRYQWQKVGMDGGTF